MAHRRHLRGLRSLRGSLQVGQRGVLGGRRWSSTGQAATRLLLRQVLLRQVLLQQEVLLLLLWGQA